MIEYVLTLRCPDTTGIVHAVASGLLDAKGNILEQAQFTDPDLNQFCLLTRFETPEVDVSLVRDSITAAAARFDPVITLRKVEERRRVLVMVSKFDHCLVDLLYRWQTGELPIDIPLIVSNHPDLRPIADAARHPLRPPARHARRPSRRQEAELLAARRRARHRPRGARSVHAGALRRPVHASSRAG